MGAVSIPLLGRAEIPDSTRRPSPVKVALVNMPFAAANRPSIQCGLLKAGLVRVGHAVDVFYLNLELAVEVGHQAYAKLADLRTELLLGEWLFSVAAFGNRGGEAEYRAACPSLDATCHQLGLDFGELCHLRDETLPALIDRWVDMTDWSIYAAVGFTSTFEQNVAALALARKIKERHPRVTTIFGGANFDGEMGPEYVRAFEWIDYAVVGEGDEVLPALVDRISAGVSGAGMTGVTTRVGGAVVEGGQVPLVRNLDELPDPDYDEFFVALCKLGRERVLGTALPLLLFESARGCWWGQKHHCTFCGLNANGMGFRSKSPARVHEQLRRLADRYKIINFEAVDNIIDMRYLEQLCRPLSEERYDYQIFYEVKANLTRQQLRTLAHGGVTVIQPGIESLSTHILTLMRKGTTMLRNVRLLKWAHYYGLSVAWNLLTGFPGETRADYQAQERLIPLLSHLPPPTGSGPIWLERFSPYFKDRSFPVRDVRPWAVYRLIYPEDQIDLRKVAYFFSYEMEGVLPQTALRSLHVSLDEWRDRWRGPRRPVLVYQRAPDWLQVIDGRNPAIPQVYAFHGPEAAAYEFCGETDHSAARVTEYLERDYGPRADAASVERMLGRFCDEGLMVEEDGHYLSLALPVNGNW